MPMHTLFDSSLHPEQLPDCRYAPDADVVSVREASDIPVIAEVYKRAGGTFGFRFQAWVAWRDAGGDAAIHGMRLLQRSRFSRAMSRKRSSGRTPMLPQLG
jgi:hypothetical protein